TEGLGVPEYLVTETGPDHETTFTAAARVGGVSYGTGTGRSKKEAEQQAAESAWRAIRSAADERAKVAAAEASAAAKASVEAEAVAAAEASAAADKAAAAEKAAAAKEAVAADEAVEAPSTAASDTASA
ncbi:putative dsRNA-binding protein, partial [Streptomyces sp. NPDC058656]|uniref:putative dsRNA-binding protein n=1 Tax=Streptomyces sp. NPDC058656 TaxID=3346578 RepID=UPI00365E230C